MKTPFSILAAVLIALPASAQREYSIAVPSDAALRLSTYQAESLSIALVATNADLFADAVLFDVVSATNLLQARVAVTATVSGATATIALSPEQANLPVGNYLAFARAVTLDGTNITAQRVLARAAVEWKYNPDSRFYDFAGPLSYQLDESDPFWVAAYSAGLNLASMTNPPSAWTNQPDLSGYATGTPVYVESDPAFAASASSGITSTDTQQWTEAHGWGDHAAAGYYALAATATPSNLVAIGGTVTVSAASGPWQAHVATGPTSIAVAPADTGTISSIRFDLRAGTNAITWLAGVNYDTFTASTTTTTVVLYDSPWGVTTWRAWALEDPE